MRRAGSAGDGMASEERAGTWMDFCPRLYRFSQHALARFSSLRYGRHGNDMTVFQLNLEGEACHLYIFQNGAHAHLAIGRALNRGNTRLGTIECRRHHILRNSGLDAHMGKSRGNGGSGGDPFGFLRDLE